MSVYVLDTNTCIFAIKNHPTVVRALGRVSPEQVHVTSMTVAELIFGVRKSRRQAENQAILDAFLAPLLVVDFDLRAADAYASIRLRLELAGTRIGERDLIIAATAYANALRVVTNNTREFSRVPGLVVEDWSKD